MKRDSYLQERIKLKNNTGIFIDSYKPYLFTAAAIILSYLVLFLRLKISPDAVHINMLMGVAICLLFAYMNRSRIELVIVAIIIAGIILRMGYMLYTPFDARTHDLDAQGASGQYDYMYNLFTYGTLPATNQGQFYHPPLQQTLQVLVAKFIAIFQPNAGTHYQFDATKIVPCFASSAILWVSYKICRETKLPGKATLIAISLIAFLPIFFLLSAFVNNDAFMLLFFMVAVLYTIRWYYNQTMRNIIFVALGIGLSMMTKVSGGMVALFIAPVFIAVLIQKIREKKLKGLIAQFAVFLSVSLPLALWYPIRQKILFSQPLNYVVTPAVGSPMYCGNMSFVQRFLSFPPDQILNPLYANPSGDYSLWLYTLKSSIFGDFTFTQPAVLAQMLILANLVMILFSLAAMIYVMLRCKQVSKFIRFGLFWIWLTQMVSFILFNFAYPFGSTMDFRYIMPTAITGAIYFGVALHAWKDKNKPAYKVFYYAGIAAFIFFTAASVLFFALPFTK